MLGFGEILSHCTMYGVLSEAPISLMSPDFRRKVGDFRFASTQCYLVHWSSDIYQSTLIQRRRHAQSHLPGYSSLR